jgi:hypothetical protein
MQSQELTKHNDDAAQNLPRYMQSANHSRSAVKESNDTESAEIFKFQTVGANNNSNKQLQT